MHQHQRPHGRPHLRVALATATAAALTGGLLSFAAAPAPAADSTYVPQADFNGDGYRDVAVGAMGADVGSVQNAGAVVVLYGSSTGVSATRKTVITQNSTGVPGAAEEGDRFGYSLAAADLNGDKYADLVVGSQYEAIGDREGVGTATVIWGGSSGLSGGAALPQPSPSELNEWGGYGSAVATGDFDGDGKPDVTVTGQNHIHLYRGPFTRTGTGELGGAYEVTAGDLTGDGDAERVYPYLVDGDPGGAVPYYTYDPGNWDAHPESDYALVDLPNADGEEAVIADVNGDTYGDLVLGDYQDPRADKPGGHKGGQITVWYGGPNGPDPAQKPTVIHQDTTGVPGAGETDDVFGSALSAGDVNGDGYADIAVGAWGEDLGSVKDAGSVTLLFGSASGLTGTGARSYSQDTAGVPGSSEYMDAFGMTVRLVDLDKNGRADLVTGAGYENGYGAVTVLRAASSGLTTSGAKFISARDAGIKGGGEFAWAIAQ
ncbi:FG-GAP-like repeat-containing protein [Streptomyces bullii]|uniref:FG-GAP-like repeat-containing protein n=1 Tax=Streptomyces bullii TaxID=349910 RepID=A0ABW0UP32_9ACTN